MFKEGLPSHTAHASFWIREMWPTEYRPHAFGSHISWQSAGGAAGSVTSRVSQTLWRAVDLRGLQLEQQGTRWCEEDGEEEEGQQWDAQH